ncbi:hypothetical protein G9A89_008065 [Geosiphon pyriformis]|nr:hypothetical protein G9A89_008065 [Geosiphon pyriformis]
MQPPIYQSSVYQALFYQPTTPVIYQPQSQNYLSLLVTSEDAPSNNLKTNQKSLTNNIPPVIIIENESLIDIFSFEIEELSETPLFSRAAFKKKLITAMYTDTKIDGHLIKLILDSKSAGSIITRQFMDQLNRQVDRAASTKIITTNGAIKTPISEIDDLSIKVNGIIVLIKNTQKLQISQNSQHTHVPAMCGHFKPINPPSAPFIKFEKEEKKPT